MTEYVADDLQKQPPRRLASDQGMPTYAGKSARFATKTVRVRGALVAIIDRRITRWRLCCCRRRVYGEYHGMRHPNEDRVFQVQHVHVAWSTADEKRQSIVYCTVDG